MCKILPDLIEFSALRQAYWLSEVCKVQHPDLTQFYLIVCVPQATENSSKTTTLRITFYLPE